VGEVLDGERPRKRVRAALACAARFPSDYPQSAVTPDALVYPVASLGRFRTWLDEEYLPKHYAGYVHRKVKQKALPASRAELLIATLVHKQLADGDN
jgi:hypothetical protein